MGMLPTRLYLLAVVLVAPSVAALDHEDSITYQYEGEGFAVGAFSLQCDAIGAIVPTDGSKVTMAIASGTWRHTTTDAHRSVVGSMVTHEPVASDHQEATARLPAGLVTISGYGAQPLVVFPRDGEAFGYHETGQGRAWSVPTSGMPVPGHFIEADDTDVLAPHARWQDEAFAGPYRLLGGPSGDGVYIGSLRILIIEGRVTAADGTTFETGAYRTPMARPPQMPGVLEQRHETVRAAWLDVVLQEPLVVPKEAQTLCAGIRLSMDGPVTLYQATARYDIGGERGGVTRQTLTVSGVFTLDEKLETGDTGTRRVVGRATGDIDLVAADFAPVAEGPPISPATGAAVLTGIGLLLLLVGRLPFWVGLYSRISEDKILAHPVRAAAWAAVQASPAATIAELASRIGIARSALRYHLGCLVQHGLVRLQRIGARTVAVPAGMTGDEARQARTAALDLPRYVLDAIATAQRPQSEVVRRIQERFQVTETAARKAVRRCETDGLLERVEQRGEVMLRRAGS